MSVLSSLAQLEAVAAGRAQPLATVRHCHLAEAPLVLVPLKLAGEAAAPLAVVLGTDRKDPALLIVPQPRNRDLRFSFAADLAKPVLNHIEAGRGEVEELPPGKDGEERIRYADAPQLLVPNRPGVAFLRLLGRSTRFRRTEGRYAVDASVPALGRWLTWFADRHDHPGSSLLLAMTEVLRLHWATGQSALEDGNLAALMGWIDPPGGLDGPAAASRAEDPVACPPAGPATDPSFDNEVLADAIATYDKTGDPRAQERIRKRLEEQLMPTWDLMWQAVNVLRALPDGAGVPARWERDRDAFTYFHQTFGEGYPQARRDPPVRAARRLHDLERAQDVYEAQRAFDDPLVMAEHRLTGQAFGGAVTAADPTRLDESGKRPKLRPHLRVHTADPIRLDRGTMVCDASRPTLKGRIVQVDETDGGTSVLIELTGGMGRKLTPEPGIVPEAGTRVVFTSRMADGWGAARFPDREDTPWTHGGPPEEYEPTDQDAAEDWE